MGHSNKQFHESDRQPIGAKATPLFLGGLVLGLVALGLAAGLAFMDKEQGWSRFGFAYLVSFAWVLAITLGSLFFILFTHLFKAGWVVAVRRPFEAMAMNIPVVGLLAVPVLLIAALQPGALYPWSQKHEVTERQVEDASAFLDAVAAKRTGQPVPALKPENEFAEVDLSKATWAPTAVANMAPDSQYADQPEVAQAQQKAHWLQHLGHAMHYKGGGDHGKFKWLCQPFFTVRVFAYFVIWGLMAWFYWSRSVRQDKDRDPQHTVRREAWAPLLTVVMALSLTMGAFDLVLSLDPAWFSTMFGVYFFANAMLSALCLGALVVMLMSKKGALKTASTDHLHDIAKLMFAFTFFWGYVAYSQFMLIWYANLPEETYWFEIRGATTLSAAPQSGSSWSVVSLVLLLAHLFIPFAFLLSRHVKRNRAALAGGAIWLLAVVWLDFYWLIMPQFNFLHGGDPTALVFGLPEILCFVGLAALAGAFFVRRLASVAPIAHGDPRLYESVALDTSVWAPIHHPPAAEGAKH